MEQKKPLSTLKLGPYPSIPMVEFEFDKYHIDEIKWILEIFLDVGADKQADFVISAAWSPLAVQLNE